MHKILCPWHPENTPSCHVYHDGYKCYSCGRFGSLEELGLTTEQAPPEVEPEDLAAAFAYIDSLPLTEQRGLMLPTDDVSFFIPWPGREYYKRRFFDPGKGPKYIGSRGHDRTPFWASREGSTLVVVEGELNALSISQACPELAVMSPGGAGDFAPQRIKRLLHLMTTDVNIILIADADAAGAKAVVDALGVLRAAKRTAGWMLMAPDANEVFQNDPAALTAQISRGIEKALEAGAQAG